MEMRLKCLSVYPVDNRRVDAVMWIIASLNIFYGKIAICLWKHHEFSAGAGGTECKSFSKDIYMVAHSISIVLYLGPLKTTKVVIIIPSYGDKSHFHNVINKF